MMRQKAQKNRKKAGTFREAAILLFSILLPVFAIYQVATADAMILTRTQKEVFVGDAFLLSGYLSSAEVADIRYYISDNSEDMDCITLDTSGKVTAVKEGSAVITIEYKLAGGLQTGTESFYVQVDSPESLETSYGQKLYLEGLEVYSPEEYTYTFSGSSIALSGDGASVLVQGFQDTRVYVEGSFGAVLVADITIDKPEFQSEKMTRAAGTEAYTPEILNYTPIEGDETVFQAEDATVASVSQSAVTAKAVGKTKVTAVIHARNEEQYTLSFHLTVTNPVLKKSRVVLAEETVVPLPVKGMGESSTCESADEGEDPAYIDDDLNIYGSYKGSAKLHFVIDGKKFSLQVIVTDPAYKKSTLTMYRGLSKGMKLTGINKKYSSVSYSSVNKKIASVTKKGTVKAKKVGVTRIKIKADGKKIEVSVQISAKKAYRAAKKEIAISKQKTHYSQARRMQKGYYDCSSLVTRVYRKCGVYFGSRSGWAPTAAALGQWCASHKKVIAKKGISYNKLVPGDLLFYSYSGNNGRYRNIDHIDMYVGEGMVVSASSSSNAVVQKYYYPGSVVLVARPVMK